MSAAGVADIMELMATIRGAECPGCHALAADLARYRSAVIPKADFDRVLEQRDSAMTLADALTREVANLRDRRANVALTEAVGYLSAELADHAKDFVHPATAIRRNLMRGFVAEHGGKVGEE
jgi:hypothetical protein